MAKSGEIQARRSLIAHTVRADGGSEYTVDTLLDRLLELPEMRKFWDGFAARQKLSRQKAKPASISGNGRPGKRNKKNPVVKGGLDVTSAVRLVQRDLEILEEQGLVEAFARQDGKRVVVTASDRKARSSGGSSVGAGQPVFWRAGSSLEDDLGLDSVAAAVALRTICRDLAWLVPQPLMEELLDARDKAELRVRTMTSTSPVQRWLAALEPESPSSQFERPMFDEDVRHAIEQAIMQRKKLRLQTFGSTFVASVSRFIVKLPDRPVIEVWNHEEGELYPGGPRGPWCSWLRLETIKHAELLPEEADLSAARAEASVPAEKPKPGHVFEFRASPRQMAKWAGTWIDEHIEVLGADPDGWNVCRYADMGEPAGFRRYLVGLGAAVEVLKPVQLRASIAEHFEAAAAMYRDVQAIPVDVEQARVDAETLAAWGGSPRLISPEWVQFSSDDLERLGRSSAWQQEPEVIEELCRLFCAEDPAGICTPENPHSATEYLAEVERLLELLPTLGTEKALAEAIRDVVHQGFSSDDLGEQAIDFDDWIGMASVAWLELTGYRSKMRRVTTQQQ